ncbi:unnamed protein product [Prorocentrum cordatum]|uniref:Reverse transcriptase Ty1/copia-type domain-containing protein n=1 Tax=Prorocentrum cordatum TaxID=2364126 RepID=A0ABN9WQP0_9DINO|nr:unnamed protein product [Polarella glacialis]
MMTETLDEISYVRLFIYELECGQVDNTNKQHVNDAMSSCPGVLVTDGKSGYDAIEKSESAGLGLRDKRTSIECLGIRQQKEQTALQIRWVHSDAMLADGLSKDRAAKVLLEFFRSGQRWRLVDDPLHRSARKRKTEGLDKLDHGKPISDDNEDAMLEALIYYARDNPDEQESPAGDAALWGMIRPLTRSDQFVCVAGFAYFRSAPRGHDWSLEGEGDEDEELTRQCATPCTVAQCQLSPQTQIALRKASRDRPSQLRATQTAHGTACSTLGSGRAFCPSASLLRRTPNAYLLARVGALAPLRFCLQALCKLGLEPLATPTAFPSGLDGLAGSALVPPSTRPCATAALVGLPAVGGAIHRVAAPGDLLRDRYAGALAGWLVDWLIWSGGRPKRARQPACLKARRGQRIKAAGADLDEYSAASHRARDIDLVYLGQWSTSHWLPGTWAFGDAQKLLDQNEVIDLSNESPPTGEDLAADDGESVSARTFEGNDWKSDLFLDRDLQGDYGRRAIPGPRRPRSKTLSYSQYSQKHHQAFHKRKATKLEAFSYYLQEGNFYGDYAYSVQQYDETKEDDELIVLDIPVSNEHAFMAYMDNPSNFVASQARKGRVEVSFKKATPEEKKLLLEAQQKECTSVLSAKAVRILSRKGIDPARLLRWRFVLTWKKDEQGNVLRGKARLVVLGFSDPDLLHLRTESPVAARRARQLPLAMAARHKWKLEKADAVTAFLQGETDEEKREIYADPPKDVRQAFGMKYDDVLQFLKPMYGFVHAPRKWWLHFQDTLRTLKLEIVQCEPCVWVIRDGNQMVGMVILHVDDMMIAGDHNNSAFLKKRQEIQQAFEWTPWESRAFVQCGISIRQNEDYTCSLAQDSYSLNVEPIKIRRGSSTSAEVQMMTETLDEISYVRLFIYELECGQVDNTNKQHVNDAMSSCPGVLVTDGKSGYDAIEKSESAGLGLRDKRTSIECLGIRQQKEQTALQIRWVHSDAMLADGLSKDRAAKVLLEFFRSGQRWRLVDDPLHRSARKRKTEGLDKLDHGKPISDDNEDAMLEALIYYARDNPDEQESPAGDAALWGMIRPLTRSVLSVNSVARGGSRCRNIDL